MVLNSVTTASNSPLAKLFTACQKTLSNRSNAMVFVSIAVGCTVSSCFRSGLLASPLGIISSVGITALSSSPLGKRILLKLPQLPNRMQSLATKVSSFLHRILPESSLTTSVMMPLIEEGIFRGAMQSITVPVLGPVGGVLASSLAFSAVHYDPDQPGQLVNSLIGGIALGAIKEKVSLLGSIGYHIGVNTFWGPVLGFNGPEKGLVRNYLES